MYTHMDNGNLILGQSFLGKGEYGVENEHALSLSHNQILDALRKMWESGDVKNPEFMRLCMVYKNRFGQDVTVGMLDLVKPQEESKEEPVVEPFMRSMPYPN